MVKKKVLVPIKPEDQSFFSNFYDEYINFIYFTAKKYASTIEDRQDLVQDTIVRLIQNIATLKQLSQNKIAKYISLTVRTTYLDRAKQKSNDTFVSLDEAEVELILHEQLHMKDSDQMIAASDAVRKLKRELSPRDWLVLDAKYILGLSQEEIGTLIGVSPGSVRMVLHRAKGKAKQILKDEIIRR